MAGVEGRGGSRPRRRVWVVVVGLALAAMVAVALLIARPWEEVPPTMSSPHPPDDVHSVSVDFDIVVDPRTDWNALDAKLDDAGANGVDLNAGRVEFTGFDWAAHPGSAAEPGTDHIARAARALRQTADGTQREIGLIVDAYVPNWITQDPSIAGESVEGEPAPYTASAVQLARGPVGDRLVEYVAALGERYLPSQIAITELFLDVYSYGDDDLELFREMTGEADWPRTADGQVDTTAPVLGAWRSEVIAGLLGRMRAALDEVRDGEGARVALAMDVRIDWSDPAQGSVLSGHDYATLLQVADRLILWAYLRKQRSPAEIEGVTAALAAAGYEPSRFTISVGLWARSIADPNGRISTSTMVEAVREAATNGVTDVNLTPLSLMTDADWTALGSVWRPGST